MLVRSRLPGLSGTGVLADRALLVVTEYLEHGELPADGHEILSRFKVRFDEAQHEASQPGFRSIGTASLGVRSASQHALDSLTQGGRGDGSGHPTMERIMATLAELGETGRADTGDVQTLRDFLAQYSENTLHQRMPKLGGHSLFDR
jgi:hypothetical protein